MKDRNTLTIVLSVLAIIISLVALGLNFIPR